MKCGFPMAAQISFAHMFSLPLWNFQCSDEISFVSARFLWFMMHCQRKSFQIIPWIWILFSKTYLIEQNTWILRMQENLRVFLGKLKHEKNKTQLLELSHNKTKKPMFNQSQLISETTPSTKLHGRSLEKNSCGGHACHGARALGLFFGCGCHTTAHLGHRWWPWLSYKLQGIELINSWDSGFVCIYNRFV